MKESKKIKIAVGMSGGVDSSVAAFLLKKQGYNVVGLFMKLWHDPCGTAQNACCDDKALMDAREVADKLGIPFYVVDAREVFKKEITDYFVDEYKNLRTPNPCYFCNKKIKFGWLIDFAKKIDCDYVATGHYARIEDSVKSVIPAEAGIQKLSANSNQTPGSPGTTLKNIAGPEDDNSFFKLLKGVDPKKDQSYFLSGLNQDQLSYILFPLGEMTKEEVRKIAKAENLPVFEKKESQEVCFVADDYRDFLRRQLGDSAFKAGDIVDQHGYILGKHNGLLNYTIGQRKGIEQVNNKQSAVSDRKPLYVVEFDTEKNRLIVGEQKELYKDSFEIKDLNLLDSRFKIPASNLTVKIRYQAKEIPCSIKILDSRFKIQLHEPALAPTAGQIAVFYDEDEVVASGIIAN